MAGYLYLYYEDYVIDNNPNMILSTAKETIRKKAESKLNFRISSSKKVEQDFQKLYGLEGTNLVNADVNQRLAAHEPHFRDFDDAISKLDSTLKEGKSVIEAINLGNKCLDIIDRELKIGANTMGLAESAIYEVQSAKNQLHKVVSTLMFARFMGKTNTSEIDKSIKDDITGLHSNAAGYLLELAWIEAFVGANAPCLGQMLSIGGKGARFNNIKVIPDPKLQRDWQKLDSAAQRTTVQTGADAVFNLHPKGVTGKTSWVGFQIKNYQDLSSVGIGNYSLKDLNIEEFYSQDFMVNVAGTLTEAFSMYGPYSSLKQLPQQEHDATNLYSKMINSTKILGIADVIAGKMRGFMHNRHYWVVRGKGTGNQKVRVIGTSTILNIIKNMYITNNNTRGLGFSTGANPNISSFYDRAEYTIINASNFDDNDHTGLNRSSMAIPIIYKKILDTKISVSINFSKIFAMV